MDNIAMEDLNVNMDDPEGGCIVQADNPQMLAVAAFDGSAGPSGNSSCYWSSMLKLMEQGSGAPASTSSTHNANMSCTASAHIGATCQQLQAGKHTAPPNASSPSSSSVHDQPIDMMPQNNGINASDADNSVWGQEFLSEPIGENKGNHHQLACSEDGLHELLYPRTVLELLFSDQLKLEQIPSWPDILQQSLSGAPGGRGFSFPDKPITGGTAAHDLGVNVDNPQLDLKFPQFLPNYSHMSGVDDRLSSSTASSTLSDNAIDQWAPLTAGSAAPTQWEHAMSAAMDQSSPLNTSVQQVDVPTVLRVKQEYSHGVASPPFTSNYDPSCHMNYMHQQPHNQRVMTSFEEAMMMNIEQKPNAVNKLWNTAVLNHVNIDPLSHIHHKHHIYESITAANLSHNLRQVAGLTGNGSYFGVGDPGRNIPAPGGPSASTALSQLQGKKARPFPESEAEEFDHSKAAAANNGSGGEGMKQQQLPGTEPNSCKRSKTEQSAPTAANSSTSSLKNPPIRKEKLSERITTLQQLVSPFGKTDTASVLLEAIGYIKFLQDQVQQALSSPYFKSPSSNQSGERNQNGDEGRPDLRSRGLCLVPLSCTMQVANDNGADYWLAGSFR